MCIPKNSRDTEKNMKGPQKLSFAKPLLILDNMQSKTSI